MDFPGNSHTSKIKEPDPEKSEASERPKKLDPVVTGKVTLRRKTLGARFKEMFVSDGGNFVDFLIETVVVPAVKEMLASAVRETTEGFRQGIEERLYPGGRPSSRTTRPGNTSGPVNYTRYNTGATSSSRRDVISRQNRHVRRSNAIEDIIVGTREGGDRVLENLNALVDDLGHCTVGDLYDLVGEKPRSTDESWGWYDLSRARVLKVSHNEFLINMPEPEPIDNGR